MFPVTLPSPKTDTKILFLVSLQARLCATTHGLHPPSNNWSEFHLGGSIDDEHYRSNPKPLALLQTNLKGSADFVHRTVILELSGDGKSGRHMTFLITSYNYSGNGRKSSLVGWLCVVMDKLDVR
ncbi:hypothetical protein ACFE04_030959 [Oxalis oulophora]